MTLGGECNETPLAPRSDFRTNEMRASLGPATGPSPQISEINLAPALHSRRSPFTPVFGRGRVLMFLASFTNLMRALLRELIDSG